jgi:DNA-binding NarL/FixJ family response regulator
MRVWPMRGTGGGTAPGRQNQMNRIILADNQAIFRAGAARVLALEDDMRIVAQCDDLARLQNAIDAYRGSVVMFSLSMGLDCRGGD